MRSAQVLRESQVVENTRDNGFRAGFARVFRESQVVENTRDNGFRRFFPYTLRAREGKDSKEAIWKSAGRKPAKPAKPAPRYLLSGCHGRQTRKRLGKKPAKPAKPAPPPPRRVVKTARFVLPALPRARAFSRPLPPYGLRSVVGHLPPPAQEAFAVASLRRCPAPPLPSVSWRGSRPSFAQWRACSYGR